MCVMIQGQAIHAHREAMLCPEVWWHALPIMHLVHQYKGLKPSVDPFFMTYFMFFV